MVKNFVSSPLQAPESYKNVTDVVNTCKSAQLAVYIRPSVVQVSARFQTLGW